MNAIERQKAAAKHGRWIKAERIRQQQINEIKERSDLDLHQKLEVIHNIGYLAGFADGEKSQATPHPLYNKAGKQIREVTQTELEWKL
jgi:hypothetical protein